MDHHLALALLKNSAEKTRRIAHQSKDACHVAECLAIANGFDKLADDLQRLLR